MTEPALLASEWREWLRELKDSSGVSYADIARSIGEDERLVKKWMPETGEPVMPRGEAMLKLLDFFGVTMTPPLPKDVAGTLTGDLRVIRSEISELVTAEEHQDRLAVVERKLDAGQQKTAESLAKLASAIDELSDRLLGEEPGSPRQKRAKP